jgi:uncharacterized protein YbbK (DUF523 family)
VSAPHELYRRLHEAGPEEAEAAAREVAETAQRHGRRVVVVSACLLGEKTRYDGGDKHVPEATDTLLGDPGVEVMPLCPEILGGMGCPRPPVHFADGEGDTVLDGHGRIVDDQGQDHTAPMSRGAERADELARLAGAEQALLKERSPSCGARQIHGAGGVRDGRGVFAARLARRHLPVLSEEDVIKDGS